MEEFPRSRGSIPQRPGGDGGQPSSESRNLRGRGLAGGGLFDPAGRSQTAVLRPAVFAPPAFGGADEVGAKVQLARHLASGDTVPLADHPLEVRRAGSGVDAAPDGVRHQTSRATTTPARLIGPRRMA